MGVDAQSPRGLRLASTSARHFTGAECSGSFSKSVTSSVSAGARISWLHPRLMPGYPCQAIVSGYTLQLPPPAWVLSKAQLREIQFKGGSLKGHTFHPFFQILIPSQSEDWETALFLGTPESLSTSPLWLGEPSPPVAYTLGCSSPDGLSSDHKHETFIDCAFQQNAGSAGELGSRGF